VLSARTPVAATRAAGGYARVVERRVSVITAAAAVLAVAAGLFGAERALACSCVPPDPPAMLESSDGAFVGRLVAVRVVDPPAEGEPTSSGDPTDYIYRVGRVYRHGPGLRRGRRVSVRSARDGATCGLPRGRGRLFGLFLQRQGHRWHSNSCLVVGPRQLRRAAGDAGSSRAPSRGSAGCG
jgi:hypothetical protein